MTSVIKIMKMFLETRPPNSKKEQIVSREASKDSA